MWRFNEHGETFTVPVTGSLESNEGTSLIRAAVGGLGVVWAPRFLVQEFLNRGELAPVLMQYQSRGEGVYVVYPHREQLPKKVRAVIDFLAEEVPKLQAV